MSWLLRWAAVVGAILAVGGWPSFAAAENWPQWRGPDGDGVSHERGLPTKWSNTDQVLWRLPLPGPAGATPAVWGDQIFVSTVDGADLLLLCVGTDGKEQWRRQVASGNTDVRGDEGNSASPSPFTDGQHVWIAMAEGTLACYTREGTEVYRFNLQDRYGKFDIQFGMTPTPVLDRGRIYCQLIHGDGQAASAEAAVVCLDAASGKEVWRQPRITGASSENEHSYASPSVYRDGDREFLLTHGADYTIAHWLDTGKEIWRCGLNPQGATYHPTLRFVASPLAVPGLIVIPSAKNGPVVAVRPQAQGDISEQPSAWKWRMSAGTPDVPSPLVFDGLVYLCRENGNLVCLDAESGQQLYEERTTRDRHRASPVYADGHVYLTARNGVVTVVKAGRQFALVAQNAMGEAISASPVFSNGRLYLRTFDALYAIGAK